MMQFTRQFIARLKKDERGLAAIEYAVLGAILVAGIVLMGGELSTALQTAAGKVTSAVTAAGSGGGEG